MTVAAPFLAMARNNAWANLRLYDACTKLSAEAYRARRASFFPTIELTLNHILAVDWYYLDVLDGGGGRWAELYALPDVPCPTFAELRSAQQEADRRLVAVCERLGDAGLSTIVTMWRPGGRRFVERVDAVLLHLFQHDIHHRGQVHAMLAGTEVAPPQLDEFFLDQDQPLREAEMERLGS